MSDGGESTATLKYGKGHEDSWFVAKGTPAQIKQQVIDYFGLTGEDLAEKTPHEIVLQGQSIAQGTSAVSGKLNGSIDWPSSSDRPAAAKKGGSKKKSEPKKEEDEHPWGQVLAQIELAETEDALKKLFAVNKEAFQNADVKEASKKRFAALKEGN